MSTLQFYFPRFLLTAVAGITGIVPYLADWNETHIYNPEWPGHAKFHNGQTMSMGVCLGLCTLWKTWLDNTDGLFTASVLAALYYLTMFIAWFYPGATAWDPPQHFEVSYTHLFVVVPMLTLVGVAYGLERRRVRSGRGGKED